MGCFITISGIKSSCYTEQHVKVKISKKEDWLLSSINDNIALIANVRFIA